MNKQLARPCKACPYTRAESAVRLSPERARELAQLPIENDFSLFICHETIDFDSEEDEAAWPRRKPGLRPQERECAGFRLYCQVIGQPTVAHRLERALVYDGGPLPIAGAELVYESPEAMEAGATLDAYE